MRARNVVGVPHNLFDTRVHSSHDNDVAHNLVVYTFVGEHHDEQGGHFDGIHPIPDCIVRHPILESSAPCTYTDTHTHKWLDILKPSRLTKVALAMPPCSGDSYSSTQFYIQGGYPSASDPIGQPDLPGSTTSGGLNWVGQVTSELNSTLVLTYDWAYYGADTSNAIINTGVTTDFIAQVGEFEEYLVPAPSQAPWTSSDTLVAVWFGINDVGQCFWQSSVYATCPITEVMETYFGLLEDLYGDGVRNFALLMVPRKFYFVSLSLIFFIPFFLMLPLS